MELLDNESDESRIRKKKKYRKIFFTIISITAFIQVSTYFTISNRELIKEIGKSHETFVFDNEDNLLKEINIVSELNPTEKQIRSYFKIFKNRKINQCESLAICPELTESKFLLVYVIDRNNRNPFTFNYLNEVEMGPDFAALWKSKYVWVLFKWVLIRKVNVPLF